MKQALDIAKAMKLWRVRLYVNDDNYSARALYKKMGFEEKYTCIFYELDVKNLSI